MSTKTPSSSPEEISPELRTAMLQVFKRCPNEGGNTNLGFEEKIAQTVLWGNEQDWKSLDALMKIIPEKNSPKKLLRYCIEWVVHYKDPDFSQIRWSQEQLCIIDYIKEKFPGRE